MIIPCENIAHNREMLKKEFSPVHILIKLRNGHCNIIIFFIKYRNYIIVNIEYAINDI